MASLLQAEYERLLASLSEKLDIAKARCLLHGSICLRLANSYDPVFLSFLGKGASLLRKRLNRMPPPPGVSRRDPLIYAAVKAAIVDDVNLTKVYQVLRIEELLEDCSEDLTVTMSAAVVCAILGTRLGDLEEALQRASDPYELAALLGNDFTCLSSGAPPQQSAETAFRMGDTTLEILLHLGSVVALLERLQRLYSRYWPQWKQLITWSFRRQAPRLSRMRQLTVTELMYTLTCSLDDGDKDSRARAALSQGLLSMYKDILKTIIDGLLTSGLRMWCYEREEQRIAISTKGITGPLRQAEVNGFLCIKLSRDLEESPRSWELPDADAFSRRLVERHREQFRSVLQRQPFCDRSGVGDLPDGPNQNQQEHAPLYPLIGGRLHVSAPNFADANEPNPRFFTSPLITAFMDVRDFVDTLKRFSGETDLERGLRGAE